VEVSFVVFMLHGTLAPLLNLAVATMITLDDIDVRRYYLMP
jgi:hypothetical protein